MLKRLCTAFTLCVILCTLLLSAVSASEITGYENNGTRLAGITNDSGSLSLVEENTAVGILTDGSDASGKMNVSMSATPLKGGKIELSYDIKIVDVNSEVIRIPTAAKEGERVIDPMWHEGYLAINNGTKMTYTKMSQNQWHSLKFVIDTNSCTFNMYLNKSANPTVSGNFYKANITQIDSINALLISGQSIYVKNILLKRTGEGGARIYLFSGDYSVSHPNKTIGYMPAYMKKDAFLSSVDLSEAVSAVLSSKGAWIENGDTLVLTDKKTNTEQTYTLTVRTPAISTAFAKVFNNALVLKNGADFYYCKGQAYSGIGIENNTVAKEALLTLGVQAAADVKISNLSALGCTVTQLSEEYVIVQKDNPVTSHSEFLWKYDVKRLFGEVIG